MVSGPPAAPEHAMVPIVLVLFIVGGMVALSLATVLGSFDGFFLALFLFLVGVGVLIAISPEPVRAAPTVGPGSDATARTGERGGVPAMASSGAPLVSRS